MAVWSRNGRSTVTSDVRERIAAGTLGGVMVQDNGVTGSNILSVIDNLDPRITYGTALTGSTAAFSSTANLPFAQQNSQTIIGRGAVEDLEYSAAQLRFTGTSIAVMGSMNLYSGQLNILIDGVLTAGRLAIFCGIFMPSDPTDPALASDATTFTAFGDVSSFPTGGGTLYINGELMTYTSLAGQIFSGLTRGIDGTTAADHYSNETVYLWDSAIDCGNTDGYNATKQIVYYNPFLEPGEHTITIYVTQGATTGYTTFFFDCFIADGSLLGASNVFMNTATVQVTDTTTSNGHAGPWQFTNANSDVAAVGVLGYTQTDCETNNSNTMGKLGVAYGTDGIPYFYLHNGPVSTEVTIRISIAYLGESL